MGKRDATVQSDNSGKILALRTVIPAQAGIQTPVIRDSGSHLAFTSVPEMTLEYVVDQKHHTSTEEQAKALAIIRPTFDGG